MLRQFKSSQINSLASRCRCTRIGRQRYYTRCELRLPLGGEVSRIMCIVSVVRVVPAQGSVRHTHRSGHANELIQILEHAKQNIPEELQRTNVRRGRVVEAEDEVMAWKYCAGRGRGRGGFRRRGRW